MMSNRSKLAQDYTLENITLVRWLEDTMGVRRVKLATTAEKFRMIIGMAALLL